MPFEFNIELRRGYLAPKREKHKGRDLPELNHLHVLWWLEFTGGKIAETVRRTGVSEKTVTKINRRRLAESGTESDVSVTASTSADTSPSSKAPQINLKQPPIMLLRTDALREALLGENPDIQDILDRFKIPSKYGLLFQAILSDEQKCSAIGRISGFHYNRVKEWRDWLRLPSQTETQRGLREKIIYELSRGNNNRADILNITGCKKGLLDNVIAETGIQGRNNPNQKERAILTAINEHPEYTNRMIADLLGEGFSLNYVADVRRKSVNAPDIPPDGISEKELFLMAAVELVRRNLQTGDGRDQLAEIKPNAKKPGWMPALEAKNPWSASSESFPGCSVPRYRLLDAALTYHLEKAGIKGPGDLIERTKSGFVRFEKLPLQIFQALHFTLAAQDVTFDRLKIQHGHNQSWLPSRSQMIITAKQMLGLKR